MEKNYRGNPNTYYEVPGRTAWARDGKGKDTMVTSGSSGTYVAPLPHVLTGLENGNGHNGHNGISYRGLTEEEQRYLARINSYGATTARVYLQFLTGASSEQIEKNLIEIIAEKVPAVIDHKSNVNGNGKGHHEDHSEDTKIFFEIVGQHFMEQYTATTERDTDRRLELAVRVENLAHDAKKKGSIENSNYLYLKSAGIYLDLYEVGDLATFSAGGYEYGVRERVVSQVREILDSESHGGVKKFKDPVIDTLSRALQSKERTLDDEILYPIVKTALTRIEDCLNGEDLVPAIPEFAELINRSCQAKIERIVRSSWERTENSGVLSAEDKQGVLDACEANLRLLVELYGMNSPKTKMISNAIYSDSHEIAALDDELSRDLVTYASKVAGQVYEYGPMMTSKIYDEKFSQLFSYYLSKKINAYEYYGKYHGESDELTLAKFALLDQIMVHAKVIKLNRKQVISNKTIEKVEKIVGFPVEDLISAGELALANKYYEIVARTFFSPDIEDKNAVISKASDFYCEEMSRVYWANRCQDIELRNYRGIKGETLSEREKGYNSLLESMSYLDRELGSQEEVLNSAKTVAIDIRRVAGTGSVEMVRLQTVLMNRIKEQLARFDQRAGSAISRNQEMSRTLSWWVKSQAGRINEKWKPQQEDVPEFDLIFEDLFYETEVLNVALYEYGKDPVNSNGRGEANREYIARSKRDLVEAARNLYPYLVDRDKLADRLLLLIAAHDVKSFREVVEGRMFSEEQTNAYNIFLKISDADPRTVDPVNLFVLGEELKDVSGRQGGGDKIMQEFLALCFGKYRKVYESVQERLKKPAIDLGGFSVYTNHSAPAQLVATPA